MHAVSLRARACSTMIQMASCGPNVILWSLLVCFLPYTQRVRFSEKVLVFLWISGILTFQHVQRSVVDHNLHNKDVIKFFLIKAISRLDRLNKKTSVKNDDNDNAKMWRHQKLTGLSRMWGVAINYACGDSMNNSTVLALWRQANSRNAKCSLLSKA